MPVNSNFATFCNISMLIMRLGRLAGVINTICSSFTFIKHILYHHISSNVSQFRSIVGHLSSFITCYPVHLPCSAFLLCLFPKAYYADPSASKCVPPVHHLPLEGGWTVRRAEGAGAAHKLHWKTRGKIKSRRRSRCIGRSRAVGFSPLPPVSFVVSALIKIWWTRIRTTTTAAAAAAATTTSLQASHPLPVCRSRRWMCSRLTTG